MSDKLSPTPLQPVTIEVFRSMDGRVFANVNQGGIQLAHLKAGESFMIEAPTPERCSFCSEPARKDHCGNFGCPYGRETPSSLQSESREKFTREDAAKLVERKAKALTEEYCHGDAGPGGYVWSNREAEWQVILLEELAEEIRNAKGI